MEHLPTLLALAATHLVMAALPGPNSVLVAYVAVAHARGAAVRAVAGVTVASLVWVALSLLGLGALLVETGWLYRLLRLLGAAYLLFLGIRLLRGRPGADGGRGVPAFGSRRPFVAGLLTTLSNPKSAVFWTSVFLVTVPEHPPAWVWAAILAIVGVQSALWYGALALVFSSRGAGRARLRLAGWLDRLAGGVMLLLGLRLARDLTGDAVREIAAGVRP